MPFFNQIDIPPPEELTDFKYSELESGYNTENNTWEVIVKYHGDILNLENISNVEVEVLSEKYAIITLNIYGIKPDREFLLKASKEE